MAQSYSIGVYPQLVEKKTIDEVMRVVIQSGYSLAASQHESEVRVGQQIAVDEDKTFCEFRRKARRSELLSASVEKLLREIRFTGRISMVVKNGTVMKAGYEEFEGQSRAASHEVAR